MSDPHPVVPLRTSRRGYGLLIRIPHTTGLLVDSTDAEPEQLLLDLGPTSTLELRALAARHRTRPTVATLLTRLAQAAEDASARPQLLDHIVLTGGGPVPVGLRPLLAGYARHITRPEGADALLDRGTPVDLVIPVTCEALDLDRCEAWMATGSPILPVVTRGDVVVIGPLFAAGRSPCPRCVEQHRVDRDPPRRDLLVAPDPGLHDSEQFGLEPAQAATVVGLVATFVRCLSRGVPLPPELSLTVRSPYPEVEHHEWTPHPRCSCTDVAIR